MSKHYTMLCLLVASALALPAHAQTAGRDAARKPLVWAPASQAKAVDTKDVIQMIDEDFSGLTDGSEQKPSAVSLLNEANGSFLNPEALHPYNDQLGFQTWGGGGLYAAGGCVAIKDGFLNTPAGDMSGLLTVTFRARLAGDATKDSALMDLILLSRKKLVDYARQEVTVGKQWKTYSYTFTTGWFQYTGLQFFPYTTDAVLIDDIHVERVKTSIMPPTVLEPTNMGETGFTAMWEPTDDADHYLLSVYSKTPSKDVLSVSEGFDGIKADSEGRVDEANANYPADWKFFWMQDGERAIATGEGNYASAGQALRLTHRGDYVMTPTYTSTINTLKFWVKAESTDAGATTPKGTLLVSVYTPYGWTPFRYVGMEALLTAYPEGTEIDFSDYFSDYEAVYAVKFEYQPEEGDNTNLLIDDVQYSLPSAPIVHYALQDVKVDGATTDHYDVTGLDAGTDYYYQVKAVNSEFTSDASTEQEVFYVSQPVALPATNVTKDSYVARWACGPKADFFRVEQIQQTTLTEDVDNMVVLSEDFSKVKSESTEDDIADGWYEYGEPTSSYVSIDNLTHMAGWKASSTIFVNGWLGGQPQPGGGNIAGAIVTPTVDLSHNDGECTVKVRAWGYEGDWLVIQGLNQAAYGAIPFPEGGFVETSVNIPVCSVREQLTFYSNNYYPFLIDYITVTQPMKAGEKVTLVTASNLTADADVKQMLMSSPGFADHSDILYKVTALRYYNGDKDNAVASTPSELMLVQDPAGISDATATTEVKVQATQGGISVSAMQPAAVSVYTAAGQLVARRTVQGTRQHMALAKGLYLVQAGGRTVKVNVQ